MIFTEARAAHAPRQARRMILARCRECTRTLVTTEAEAVTQGWQHVILTGPSGRQHHEWFCPAEPETSRDAWIERWIREGLAVDMKAASGP